jgi:hypothetical protein
MFLTDNNYTIYITELFVTCSILASTGKSSGSGLGAWGYMAIFFTLTGIGVGIYYFTLFYPILCKKERRYDVMELSSV